MVNYKKTLDTIVESAWGIYHGLVCRNRQINTDWHNRYYDLFCALEPTLSADVPNPTFYDMGYFDGKDGINIACIIDCDKPIYKVLNGYDALQIRMLVVSNGVLNSDTLSMKIVVDFLMRVLYSEEPSVKRNIRGYNSARTSMKMIAEHVTTPMSPNTMMLVTAIFICATFITGSYQALYDFELDTIIVDNVISYLSKICGINNNPDICFTLTTAGVINNSGGSNLASVMLCNLLELARAINIMPIVSESTESKTEK